MAGEIRKGDYLPQQDLNANPQDTDRSFPDIPQGYKTWNDYVKAVLQANENGQPGPRPRNYLGQDAAEGYEPLEWLKMNLGYARLAPYLDQADPQIQQFLDSTYYANTSHDSESLLGNEFFGALAVLGAAVGGASLYTALAPELIAGTAAAGGAEAAGGAIGGGTALGSAAGGGVSVAAPVVEASLPAAIAGGGVTLGGGGAVGPLAGGAGVLGGGTALGPLAAGAAGAGGSTLLSTLGSAAPLLGTALAVGGNIAGGVLGANAARDAAETQAQAAREALALQAGIYAQNRADMEPWRQAGTQALGSLQNLANQPLTYGPYQAPDTLDPSAYAFDPNAYAFDPNAYAFQAPNQPLSAAQYAFTPPSGQQVLADDPGYQFRLTEGQKALESSAAKRGGLLSGGTGKALQRYGQDLASQEYEKAYSRALGRNELTYGRALTENRDVYGRSLSENQMRYERGLQGNELGYSRALQGNQLNYGRAYQQNADQYGRGRDQYTTNLATLTGLRNQNFNELASLAGVGQTANTQLATLGSNYGTNAANTLTSGAAAEAAGRVGAANAIGGGLTGAGNAAQNYLQYLLAQRQLEQRQPQSPLQTGGRPTIWFG